MSERIVVVASNLRDADRAARAIRHEAGHHQVSTATASTVARIDGVVADRWVIAGPVAPHILTLVERTAAKNAAPIDHLTPRV